MSSVTETLETEIEKMTIRCDALKSEVVELRANIEDHYAGLGRYYYNKSRAAAAALKTGWAT
jgi:hypothetical protein